MKREWYANPSFQFVLKPSADPDNYLRYLLNPDHALEWNDVLETQYTPPAIKTADKMVCPICLEPVEEMIAPRVTKCGHIFCWPCLLQYLDYDRVNSWKKCPLCSEPI